LGLAPKQLAFLVFDIGYAKSKRGVDNSDVLKMLKAFFKMY